jgi:hypothetical protein
MTQNPSEKETIGYHFNRFYNNDGYSDYSSKTLEFDKSKNTWQDFYGNAINPNERHEVWMADHYRNKVYNIQIITSNKTSSGETTYIIIATEY